MMQMQWNMPSGMQKVMFPAVVPNVYGQVYTPTSNPSQQYMYTVNNTNDGLESGQVMIQLYGQQVYSNRAPVLDQAQYACTVSNRYNGLEVEECELEGIDHSPPDTNFESDDMTMVNPRVVEGLCSRGKENNLKRRVTSPISNESVQIERGAPKRQFVHQRPDQKAKGLSLAKDRRNISNFQILLLEIPEKEMIHGSVVIKAVDINAKFLNEYELCMFFKEKLSGRFEFETNREGNTIYLHLKDESRMKSALEIKTVNNIEVTVLRKEHVSRGVMKGIPLYLSIVQIEESIQSAVPVKEVIRMQRYNRDLKKLEDSLSVMVVFESIITPASVWCCGRNRDVLPYHRKVMQCYKCQKYGHLQKDCKSKEICLRCAKNHQSRDGPLKQESVDERTSRYRCANCKQNHSSTSSVCPVRRENQQVLEVAEKYGMGFKRARTTFRSYAHVVQNNLNPVKRIISNTAAELQQMTAKKLVIGMLITPGILSIENLPLNEKVDKLCELVEQMKFGKLDRNDLKLVCETSSTLENTTCP